MKGTTAPAPRHVTLVEALDEAALSSRGVTYLSFEKGTERETQETYAQVRQQARRAAATLRALGVSRGDRVALVLRTGPEFLASFYGALYAGATPVPLYPPVRLGRLDDYHASTASMLRRADAKILISDSLLSRFLGRSLERARPELGLKLASQLIGSDEYQASPDPDDLALIQFSSGSTVDPKPVALSHRNLTTHVAALHELCAPTARDVTVNWLPLYHDMGLIGALLATVAFPGPLVLIPPDLFLARPAVWLRAIGRHRGTISAAPNFAFALCLRRIQTDDLTGTELSSWRMAINGAEPISPAILRRFAERFGPLGFAPSALWPVYGLSEASLAVTFSPPRPRPRTLHVDADTLARQGKAIAGDDGEGSRELVSVGRPIPGLELEIRSEERRDLAEGQVGRIFIRGPSVMRSYFGVAAEGAASGLATDGWFDTGDLGFIEAGELFITGRAKDLIIVRGANHAPQEFEDCLEGLAGLRPGCAVALGYIPPAADGEELLILAERTAEGSAEGSALVERIRLAILQRTGVHPHTVELLAPGTLPRTSSGKLRRSEALRRYTTGNLSPPKSVHALRLLTEMARSAAAQAKWRLTRGD